MKKLTAVLMMLVLLGARALSSQEPVKTMTLSEAVENALSGNEELKASVETSRSASQNFKASAGKYLPQIGVEGRYTRLNSALSIDLSGIRSAIISADLATLQAAGGKPAAIAELSGALNNSLPAFDLSIQKEEYYNLSADVTQPLFTGGLITANRGAKKEQALAADVQMRQTRNKIVADTVTGYFQVQLMNQIVGIRREVAEGIARHQSDAERLFAEGVISKAAKMRADVALSEANRELAKALRDRELAQIVFENALGGQRRDETLVTGLFVSTVSAPLDAYLSGAAATNPNLQLLDHKRKALVQKRRAAESSFLPTVALFGKYEIYREDLTVFDPEWAAGVAARLNVFSGFSDYHEVKAVSAEIRSAELERLRASKLVDTQVRKYYHDMETAVEQYQSLDCSRGLAEENLKLNSASFREGMAPAVDVIDAELALGSVKVEQAKAMYDYDAALVSILSVSGDVRDILK